MGRPAHLIRHPHPFLACQPTCKSAFYPYQLGYYHNRYQVIISLCLLALVLSGCGGEDSPPTRTPVPTWTATPIGAAPQAQPQPPAAEAQGQPAPPPAQPLPATDTPPPPPTDTLVPTPVPTDTPVPVPTETPTEVPTPTAIPTPELPFLLETAEKFPTTSLAPNIVRIYLYVYSPDELGLAGYSLSVVHNGVPLTVDELSAEGLPEQTRNEVGPYTRFTNMNIIFVEAQAGRWELQLVDAQKVTVGPPAVFDLTADEQTRELYIRYKRK